MEPKTAPLSVLFCYDVSAEADVKIGLLAGE